MLEWFNNSGYQRLPCSSHDHHHDADCSKPSGWRLRAKYCLERNLLRPHHHHDADCSKPSGWRLRVKYCLEWNFLRPHGHHNHYSNNS
jgi:hypothetical protein